VNGPERVELAFIGLLAVHVAGKEVLDGGFAAFAAFSHGVAD
jgi:hypothetical protein